MVVEANLEAIDQNKWNDLCNVIEEEYGDISWLKLADWMFVHYNATPFSPERPYDTGVVVTKHYRFKTKEKYVEFCLRWL